MSRPPASYPVTDDQLLAAITAGHDTTAKLARRIGYTEAGVRQRLAKLRQAGRVVKVARLEVRPA